jgi:hypothetical protein
VMWSYEKFLQEQEEWEQFKRESAQRLFLKKQEAEIERIRIREARRLRKIADGAASRRRSTRARKIKTSERKK